MSDPETRADQADRGTRMTDFLELYRSAVRAAREISPLFRWMHAAGYAQWTAARMDNDALVLEARVDAAVLASQAVASLIRASERIVQLPRAVWIDAAIVAAAVGGRAGDALATRARTNGRLDIVAARADFARLFARQRERTAPVSIWTAFEFAFAFAPNSGGGTVATWWGSPAVRAFYEIAGLEPELWWRSAPLLPGALDDSNTDLLRRLMVASATWFESPWRWPAAGVDFTVQMARFSSYAKVFVSTSRPLPGPGPGCNWDVVVLASELCAASGVGVAADAALAAARAATRHDPVAILAFELTRPANYRFGGEFVERVVPTGAISTAADSGAFPVNLYPVSRPVEAALAAEITSAFDGHPYPDDEAALAAALAGLAAEWVPVEGFIGFERAVRSVLQQFEFLYGALLQTTHALTVLYCVCAGEGFDHDSQVSRLDVMNWVEGEVDRFEVIDNDDIAEGYLQMDGPLAYIRAIWDSGVIAFVPNDRTESDSVDALLNDNALAGGYADMDNVQSLRSEWRGAEDGPAIAQALAAFYPNTGSGLARLRQWRFWPAVASVLRHLPRSNFPLRDSIERGAGVHLTEPAPELDALNAALAHAFARFVARLTGTDQSVDADTREFCIDEACQATRRAADRAGPMAARVLARARFTAAVAGADHGRRGRLVGRAGDAFCESAVAELAAALSDFKNYD